MKYRNGIPMREIRAINTENKLEKEQEMQKERNIVEGNTPKLLE